MENNVCIRIDADPEQINSCKAKVNELNGSFDLLSTALSLAGNNARLKILFLINQENRLCVCDLSDILEMNISAISQHLRKLKDRNLIWSKKEGKTIYYSLSEEYKEILNPLFALLEGNKILETV